MNRDMVATAFRPAAFIRSKEGRDDFSGLVHHNDKDSQHTAGDFAELLALCGVRASAGYVGDSYDNALAESVNGTHKTERINRHGPWKNDGELNLATARWVHWHNTKRIGERNNCMTPAEIENIWCTDGVDGRKTLKNRFLKPSTKLGTVQLSYLWLSFTANVLLFCQVML
jgi:putative transposase